MSHDTHPIKNRARAAPFGRSGRNLLCVAVGVASALVALGRPARAAPVRSTDDYALTDKAIDQWLGFMRSLRQLSEADPALGTRLGANQRQARTRADTAMAEQPGKQTEAIMRQEPKVRALVQKSGLTPAEVEMVGLTVTMTAFAVQMRRQAPAQSPPLEPGTVQAKNFTLVEARLPDITKVLSAMKGDKARPSRPPQP